MALSFEGRRLSESEQLEVVQTIQENTSLEILCIMEQDTLTEAYMKEVLEDRKKELSASDGKFYKGTLRSGQVLEAGSSIIILGDVNPGATVVSKGNVVVLGTLKAVSYTHLDVYKRQYGSSSGQEYTAGMRR